MPVTFPSIANAAGTALNASLTMPDTFDPAGFGAIVDWVEIGYITNFGGLPREDVEYGRVQTFNQGEFLYANPPTYPEINPEVVFQDDDAGQDLIEANSDGQTKIAFEYVLPSGRRISIVGYASSYAPTANAPTDPLGATFRIAPIRPVDVPSAVVRWTPAP